MGPDPGRLLDLPVWRALDVDDAGRILAGHDGAGTVQLVEIAPDGTATPLTALPGDCTGRYLPGTRTVVVEHGEGGAERRQLSLLHLDPLSVMPVGLSGLVPLMWDPRHIHALVDVGPGRIVYLTNRRNGVEFDVVVLNPWTGAETVVYDRGGSVARVAVAPDGRRVALTRALPFPVSYQLFVVDPLTGMLDALTGDLERGLQTRPCWLPGSASLVVSTDVGREFMAVARLDVNTGVWTDLVSVEGCDVLGFPSPDGKTILALANDDGAARLSLHDGPSGLLIRLIDLPGDGQAGDGSLPDPVWSPDSRFVVVSYSSPTVPGDILRIDAWTGLVTWVADSTGPLSDLRPARPVSRRAPTRDGELIPCFVYRSPSPPPEPALAGSAVVVLHGGPASQSVLAFNPVVQVLAAAGHTVVVPNIRGSTGYGRHWYSADDGRRRWHAIADLAAIHAWLPGQGIDPERVALWGSSYGGFMVLAGLAFQPELWAAGVDICGMSSLVTFLQTTAGWRRVLREAEYGSLVEDLDFLESISPLNRAWAIRAPLFVIHGVDDPRVPLSEAEQLVRAVAGSRVECALSVYRDEGHGLAQRGNRMDAYARAAAFLARHLTGG